MPGDHRSDYSGVPGLAAARRETMPAIVRGSRNSSDRPGQVGRSAPSRAGLKTPLPRSARDTAHQADEAP
jgi:hypothetical protein